jgi:hypothetical protein
MKDYTLNSFIHWDKVVDYSSDETNVTLIGKRSKKLGEFNYPKFTKADFDFFKK